MTATPGRIRPLRKPAPQPSPLASPELQARASSANRRLRRWSENFSVTVTIATMTRMYASISG